MNSPTEKKNTRNQKLFWMFFPLFLGFIGLYMGIDDVRHPRILKDRCQVVGTGPAVTSLKTTGNVLYRQSDSDLNDVGLSCHKLGVVVLNDHEPFKQPISSGADATLVSKSYHYLPRTWRVEIFTGNDAS